jgi:GT2 family glycosyltransferase
MVVVEGGTLESQDNEVDVTVIVVSFNTRDFTLSCLEHLLDAVKSISFEIFVVDNASSDGSCDAIEGRFQNVNLIKNTTNRGFAEANNQALILSRGRYCLLLNSDAFVEKNTIEQLVEFLDERPRAVAAGPKVLNSDGSLQSSGNSFPSVTKAILALFGVHLFLPQKLLEVVFPRIYWRADRIAKVDWVSGCCLMLRKSAIEELGLLSAEFFMYCEEVEWCFRAYRSGYEIWYLPSACVVHKNLGSPMESRATALNRSRRIYFEKTVGRATGVIISLLTLVSAFAKYPLKLGIAKLRREPMDGSLWLGVSLEASLIRDLLRVRNRGGPA